MVLNHSRGRRRSSPVHTYPHRVAMLEAVIHRRNSRTALRSSLGTLALTAVVVATAAAQEAPPPVQQLASSSGPTELTTAGAGPLAPASALHAGASLPSVPPAELI